MEALFLTFMLLGIIAMLLAIVLQLEKLTKAINGIKDKMG